MPFLISVHADRAEFAGRHALSAADAAVLVDLMRSLDHAGDRIDRTFSRTCGTSSALFRINVIMQQIGAGMRRTALLIDMRFKFIAEVAECGEYRIRRRLSQTAECAVADGIAA